jgi:hypothetical protein
MMLNKSRIGLISLNIVSHISHSLNRVIQGPFFYSETYILEELLSQQMLNALQWDTRTILLIRTYVLEECQSSQTLKATPWATKAIPIGMSVSDYFLIGSPYVP